MWAPLLPRLSDHAHPVAREAWQVIGCMSEVAGDFLRKRVLEKVWPLLVRSLETMATSSVKADSLYKYVLITANFLSTYELNAEKNLEDMKSAYEFLGVCVCMHLCTMIDHCMLVYTLFFPQGTFVACKRVALSPALVRPFHISHHCCTSVCFNCPAQLSLFRRSEVCHLRQKTSSEFGILLFREVRGGLPSACCEFSCLERLRCFSLPVALRVEALGDGTC